MTIEPHSSGTIVATPDTATARKNQGEDGMSRRRHHAMPNQSANRISSVAIPTMASNAQWSRVFAGGRSFFAGTESSPVTFVSVLKPTSHESRPEFDPALDAVLGATTAQVLGHVPVGLLHALHRGELHRLVVGDRARRGVADRELDRSQDRGHGEGDQQAEAVIMVRCPSRHSHGVHGSDQEAGDEVCRQDHVRDLVRGRRVEDHLQGVDVGHGPVGGEVEPLRLVHP